MAPLSDLALRLIEGNAEAVKTLTLKAIQEGAKPEDTLNQGLLAGMEEVGRRFKANEFYVPEVLIAARAMKAGMEILKPHLIRSGVKPTARVALGTVKGDLHDIGKNLVCMMFEGGGFEVVDLGVDVPAERFVSAVRDKDVQIIGMSALLTTTMLSMKTTIQALKDAKIRDRIKIMIGGAPVTDAFAREIGADGFAPDAATAVDVARTLVR